MLASELATELGVDPSVITKRLGVYTAEKGIERTRILDQKTITDMQQVHQMLKNHVAPTVKIAVQKVLGTHSEAIPPDSVVKLFSLLHAMETKQEAISRLVEQIAATLQEFREQAEAEDLAKTTT
jgi:hypothetical protein